ncbi:MAG TPA: tRNA (N(6)-L-threonylcarbamoyladenosine(37)-C(2))-methylthiotransferase MtaB [Syntrophobacteria bacterium]|nr:tRNA (N(6)-L-threonylcarbamoyladenosine(37)-C(2))-methylthiotransferase MtaB [Syntrophobacteria bacterium]
MTTAAFITLGCKVNQCETAYLEERLRRAGYEIGPFSRRADLYCLNTCAVTARAAMESRQLIRRALRQNPEARVVVTGCYAQIAPAEIACIPGVSLILGSSEKLALLEHLTGPLSAATPIIRAGDPGATGIPQPLLLSAFTGRTRAFLKIQDGCDARCSYCIVPHARGRSRSIPTAPVLEQVERFLAGGFQEIVLTGIHLGQWGHDLDPPRHLTSLIDDIFERCPPPRLRLSSLEPGEITGELLDRMASEPRLCPHLHVPLQSGDAAVLREMNRTYHPLFYRDLVRDAVARVAGLAVGADILVGFPGETEACFLNTHRLLESLPLAYLHVFPFSPRPGTPAAVMRGRVPPPVIRTRSAVLRHLDRAKRLAFMGGFVGTVRPVLLEGRSAADGSRLGFSDNYIPVLMNSGDIGENRLLLARFEKIQGTRVVAAPLASH